MTFEFLDSRLSFQKVPRSLCEGISVVQTVTYTSCPPLPDNENDDSSVSLHSLDYPISSKEWMAKSEKRVVARVSDVSNNEPHKANEVLKRVLRRISFFLKYEKSMPKEGDVLPLADDVEHNNVFNPAIPFFLQSEAVLGHRSTKSLSNVVQSPKSKVVTSHKSKRNLSLCVARSEYHHVNQASLFQDGQLFLV